MKKIINSLIRISAILIAVTFALVPSMLNAQIISLNVRDGNTASNANVTGSFGIAAEGTVVGNWTNTNSFGSTNPTNNLTFNTGSNSGVSATILNPGGQQYWGADYAGTPWNYGPAAFTGTSSPVSITFENLNTAFPQGFAAMVYVNGAAANSGAAVSDGTTTFYFQTSNPANTNPILITDTDSSDGYDVGNYAKFGSSISPLTSDSITFSIPVGSVQSNNAGIGGVQLVAIPEPATLVSVLLAGFAAMFGLIGRRRRK